MDNEKLIRLFNRVILSEKLDRNIIYKIIRDITIGINLFPEEGKVSIYEIRSHIDDDKVNNNFLVKIGNNQYFSFGINDGFDDIYYQIRCNIDLYEKLFDMNISESDIHNSLRGIINFDIFLGNNDKAAKIVLKDAKNNIVYDDNPLHLININADSCYELVSRNIDDIEKVNKLSRWGSIFNMTNIEDIDYVLSNDMLTSEEKDNFLMVIKEEYDILKNKI